MHQDAPEFRSFCEPWQRMIRRKDMERRQAVPYSPASQCVSELLLYSSWVAVVREKHGSLWRLYQFKNIVKSFSMFWEWMQNYDVYMIIYIYIYMHIIYYIYTFFRILWMDLPFALPAEQLVQNKGSMTGNGLTPEVVSFAQKHGLAVTAQAKWVSLMTAYLRGIKEGMVKNCLGIGILHTWVREEGVSVFNPVQSSRIRNILYILRYFCGQIMVQFEHPTKRLKKIKLFSGLKI